MTDARRLTETLGGRWHGRYGAAPCPLCQPERRRDQRALSIADGDDGRLLVHCFKGCDFRDIAAAAGLARGEARAPDPVELARRDAERRADAERRSAAARRLWTEALPIEGTLAERYLRGRGITCALPASLSFHRACWHGPTARHWPAMLALVEGADGFAVHRTYLRPDGAGKAGLEGGDKLMLGPVAGGAVTLTDGPGRLVVAEGIETALSLACGLIEGWARIWAALSAIGVEKLRLPDKPDRLTIAPDGDKAGRGAALALADRATREGWEVTILTPPEGGDFNDLLREVAA